MTKSFIKGDEQADAMKIAATYNDYQVILKHRKQYWDSHENMLARAEKLPKTKFVNQMKAFFDAERQKYYADVFAL